ncbi:MAG: peptidoglycan-binding domain-containing protein [Pseudomonadota bacterium]
MKIMNHMFLSSLNLLARNPAGTAGVVVFGLGFSLIAANALYSQQGFHPAPIWQEKETAQEHSIYKPVRVETKPVSITRSVLTQRFSLKNIPVPTANPAREVNVTNNVTLIRDVQAALADIGLYKGKIDGISGSVTREAIMTYQASAGILPTGEASYDLLTNLKSAYAVAKLQSAQQARTETKKPESTEKVVTPKPAENRGPNVAVSLDPAAIAKIQTGLKNNFGDEQISVDGLLGNQTRGAIRRFQQRFKLEETGKLDRETLEKLVSTGIIENI